MGPRKELLAGGVGIGEEPSKSNGEIVTALPIQPVASADPTPLSVLREAMQRGTSIETLTKLFELQERWEARLAKREFDEAFAAFKAEAPKLERTKEVSFGAGRAAYKYTPLDEVQQKLDPVLARHGLSYNWTQVQQDGAITVTCTLKHVRGHQETNSLTGPADTSGNKNPIQALSSGTSYLRRYTLLGVTGKATGDEDTDGISMGEAADYIALIVESSTIDELKKNYQEAVVDGLKKQSSKAVDLYMKARQKREQELRA